MYILEYEIGKLYARISDDGIQELSLNPLEQTHENTCITDEIFIELKNQLDGYFSGHLETFDLPLNPQGTDFQKNVWNQLQKIPFGKTITYKEQALRMKNPKGIRAIASANGKNPIMIIIPCHRVIGSDGSLTGYAGGLKVKAWLLNHESSQQSLF